MPIAARAPAERVRDDFQQLLAEPAPCDACSRAAVCAAEQRACTSFALYLAGYRESRWRAAPRADATHARYLALDGQPTAPARRNHTTKREHDELPLEWLAELVK